MAQLRWHEEGDSLAATIGRPRSVAAFWFGILVLNVVVLLLVSRSAGMFANLALVLGVLGGLAVRAWLFKATLSLRGGRLTCQVGPLAPGTSIDIPLGDIEAFAVDVGDQRPSRVLVVRRSGTVERLALPLDGIMIGLRGTGRIVTGLAPADQHRFVAAWLDRALAKARGPLVGPTDPARPVSHAG